MPANYREAQGKGVCKNIKRALLRKTPQHKLPFFTPICSRASMSSGMQGHRYCCSHSANAIEKDYTVTDACNT